MSNYEFWDEIGKIFNAVVAYQEKTIEFNKRFINPWIRLGNVFDQQDRNDEAISAYQKAIEIDPNNSQTWFELANIHFRMEKYDDAIDAFNHAIEIDPGFGSPYSNLALTLVAQGKYMEAIPLYRTSIELLEEDKDKAVAWNRLGNLYRKLNEYELAVESFQKADELDKENAGFRDNLDEVPEGPTLVEANSDGEGPAIPVTLSLSELIPTDSQTEEAPAAPIDRVAASEEPVLDDPTNFSTEAIAETEAVDSGDETVTVVVQSTVETFTETVSLSNTSIETSGESLIGEATEEVVDEPVAKVEKVAVENVENSDSKLTSETEPADASATTIKETSSVETTSEEASADQGTNFIPETTESPAVNQPAYEEYLKDSNDPIHIYQSDPDEKAVESENGQASQEPVAKINTSGELQIEMDTKNAHVWNELGNVYFNTGAFDDAVIAYSKAIELDRWFAWPYSNLALTYVQKGRFVEAILLYQRSIELFSSDKDKAISWNRLGNVYRRINDYENAIASYQRADELDPDNTTLSLQSRFSLLGSYVMEQKPSYVS